MPTLTIPNTFVNGGTISASEHNANFSAVATLLNSTKIDSDNIQTGGVAAANLASGSVTTAKIADSNVTTVKIADLNVTTGKLAPNAVTKAKIEESQQIPPGVIWDYAGAVAPTGWLLCYGQAVSRTTYADLFAVLSTVYGAGDGSTTFNLPDARGRVIAGADGMGGVLAERITTAGCGIEGGDIGAAGGSETHELTEAELAEHEHTFTGSSSGGANTADTVFAAQGWVPNITNPGTSRSTTTTGSGTAHNNVQPTIMMSKIIKT